MKRSRVRHIHLLSTQSDPAITSSKAGETSFGAFMHLHNEAPSSCSTFTDAHTWAALFNCSCDPDCECDSNSTWDEVEVEEYCGLAYE